LIVTFPVTILILKIWVVHIIGWGGGISLVLGTSYLVSTSRAMEL